MIELRISSHRAANMLPQKRETLNQAVKKYHSQAGYDYHLEYYWAKFTEEQLFLLNLEYPELGEYLEPTQ